MPNARLVKSSEQFLAWITHWIRFLIFVAVFTVVSTLLIVGAILGGSYSIFSIAILQVFLGAIFTFVLITPIFKKMGLVQITELETTHLVTVALTCFFLAVLSIILLAWNVRPTADIVGVGSIIAFGAYYCWLIFRSLSAFSDTSVQPQKASSTN